MNSNKCIGFFGFIFGHNYRPRFDETDTTSDSIAKEASTSLKNYIDRCHFSPDQCVVDSILDGFRGMNSLKSIYIKDVCVRCGNTITKS